MISELLVFIAMNMMNKPIITYYLICNLRISI